MTAASRKRGEAGQIINSIRLIKGVNRRYSRELMAQHHITGQQLAALRIVSLAPGISLSDLSQRMYLHISTGSGIVDRLEKRKYLMRVRSHVDRRVVQLRITGEGRRVVKKAPEVGYGMLLQDIDKLPNGEVHRIWETMRILMKVMRIDGDFMTDRGDARLGTGSEKVPATEGRANYGR